MDLAAFVTMLFLGRGIKKIAEDFDDIFANPNEIFSGPVIEVHIEISTAEESSEDQGRPATGREAS
jgi:hypothetical protein